MKNLSALAAFLLFFAFGAQAQTDENSTPPVAKPSRDFLMVQFGYNGWASKPDSIKTSGFGREFNLYLCYDFPIKSSNFSVALGAGIGTSNIYFKDQEIPLKDTGAAANSVRFLPETQAYTKYKLGTAYLEAPLELRYFGNKINRNKGFKVAVGVRAGLLVGAHTKSKLEIEGNRTVEKVNSKRYLDKYRFSGTLRLGYGNVCAFGAYNITSLFKENQGPTVHPFYHWYLPDRTIIFQRNFCAFVFGKRVQIFSAACYRLSYCLPGNSPGVFPPFCFYFSRK